MPANESTVLQINFKVGDTLVNIYADNGGEAGELIDYVSENLLSKIVSLTQVANGANTIASHVPVAPPVQQPPAAPPVAAPAAAAPAAHLCAHNLPMKLIPAGVSKSTGRPYGAFYTCSLPRGQQCDTKVPA